MKKTIKTFIMTIGMSVIFTPLAFSVGEKGCLFNPTSKKGDCKKDTEGIWNCIPGAIFNDCTSS